MHWEGRRAAFWTRPLGVRVQKVQKVQRVQKVQKVVVGACGASFDKTLKPPCRAGKTGKPGLRRDGNAPLSPPAAVLPPEGEVCSMLSPCANLSCSLHSATKSPPPRGGRWCRRHQKGCISTGARPVVWFSSVTAINTGCLKCPAPIVPPE